MVRIEVTPGESPYREIAKVIRTWEDGPFKTYYIQHAKWRPSSSCENIWVACAPILSECGEYWPIYCMSLEFSDSTDILFFSFEEHYDPEKKDPGSSPLELFFPEHQPRHLKGTVWTREE